MTSKQSNESGLAQMVDSLKLQGHLAKMEVADPSEHESGVHKEASTLAQMRDKLRLKIHLGELEAKEEWDDVEERWRHFIQRTVRPKAKDAAESVEDTTNELLGKIRQAYKKLVTN